MKVKALVMFPVEVEIEAFNGDSAEDVKSLIKNKASKIMEQTYIEPKITECNVQELID